MDKRKLDVKDSVYLFPRTEEDLRIGVLPGVDDGIAVAVFVDTANLGKFVVPVSKYQLGAIAGVANWLLKLDESQISELRARMAQELEEQTEGEEQ